jgi:ribosomal protein L19E
MESWRHFNLIKDIEGLNDKEQIQYWKYSYHKAYGMFEDCAENTMEQVDFYRKVIRELRRQLQEAKAHGNVE